MRALLDVNVLIALLDSDHSLHSAATGWFRENARQGWASCPITQNGCLRVMSHPAYPGAPPLRVVAERLMEATAGPLHEFWPDDVSLLDPGVVDLSRIHGPRQLTALYLLALAVRRSARFVTFDAAIGREAIAGASARHLVRL